MVVFHEIEGEDSYPRLQVRGDKEFAKMIQEHQEKVKTLKQKFLKKYGPNQNKFPSFRWQPSFHDHLIRNQKDLLEHTKYIYFNCVKHKIGNDPEKYPWSSANPEFYDILDNVH